MIIHEDMMLLKPAACYPYICINSSWHNRNKSTCRKEP